MGKKFFTEDDLGIGYIDEQLTLSVENLDSVINQSALEYDKLRDEYLKVSKLGLEEEKGILTKIKDTIYNILSKIGNAIKNVFKWIGKKLGLLYDKEVHLAKLNERSKKDLDKFKESLNKMFTNKKLDTVLSEKQMKDLSKRFQTIYITHGDINPSELMTLVNNDGYKQIQTLLQNVKQLSINNTGLFKNVNSKGVLKSIDYINKVISSKFDLSGNRKNASYGRMDGNNISILDQSVVNGKRYTKFYYKSTTVTKEIDTKDIDVYKLNDYLGNIEKLLKTTIPKNRMERVNKQAQTIFDKIEETLKSKIDEVKDNKEYLDMLQNISTTIPRYAMDVYLGNIILRDNLIVYFTYIEEELIIFRKENKTDDTVKLVKDFHDKDVKNIEI